MLQTVVVALDEGRGWLLVDPLEGGCWLGLGVGRNGGQLLVVSGWDCLVSAVDLQGKMGANEKAEVAEVYFGGGWVYFD